MDLIKRGSESFEPARLFVYYNARVYEENTEEDGGVSLHNAIKALNKKGVCKESCWPYIEDKVFYKPYRSCYNMAKGNNLYQYERLDQDIDQFRACLNDNCPFVFGFNIYESFYKLKFDKTINMRMLMPTEEELLNKPLGEHAAVAVGYNDNEDTIHVLNSWGKEWGNKGYFDMPYAFITGTAMCFDFWKISFACRRNEPRPGR